MSRLTTPETAIRTCRTTYYKLVDYGIRLDKEIYLMKQRMTKIAVDEDKYMGRRQFLTLYLAELRELEVQFRNENKPYFYRRGKLDTLNKLITETLGRWHANEWHISVLYNRKQKDNAVRLILKESKRAEVQIRANVARNTLEQVLQACQTEQKGPEEKMEETVVANTKNDTIDTNTIDWVVSPTAACFFSDRKRTAGIVSQPGKNARQPFRNEQNGLPAKLPARKVYAKCIL